LRHPLTPTLPIGRESHRESARVAARSSKLLALLPRVSSIHAAHFLPLPSPRALSRFPLYVSELRPRSRGLRRICGEKSIGYTLSGATRCNACESFILPLLSSINISSRLMNLETRWRNRDFGHSSFLPSTHTRARARAHAHTEIHANTESKSN
jgi:hypothetical protein